MSGLDGSTQVDRAAQAQAQASLEVKQHLEPIHSGGALRASRDHKLLEFVRAELNAQSVDCVTVVTFGVKSSECITPSGYAFLEYRIGAFKAECAFDEYGLIDEELHERFQALLKTAYEATRFNPDPELGARYFQFNANTNELERLSP
jgi:hypothetical protein